jgi:hypothetical protein
MRPSSFGTRSDGRDMTAGTGSVAAAAGGATDWVAHTASEIAVTRTMARVAECRFTAVRRAGAGARRASLLAM